MEMACHVVIGTPIPFLRYVPYTSRKPFFILLCPVKESKADKNRWLRL